MKAVVIPEHVTEVGDSAFAYCTQLEEIVVQGTQTKFGNQKFSTTVKRIVVPKGKN